MAIFNSYVSLPEGIHDISHGWIISEISVPDSVAVHRLRELAKVLSKGVLVIWRIG